MCESAAFASQLRSWYIYSLSAHHHGLWNIGLHIRDAAKPDDDLDGGRVGFNRAILDERSKSNRGADAFDIETVLR